MSSYCLTNIFDSRMIPIEKINQTEVYKSLNEKGYSLINDVLSPQECLQLTSLYNDAARYRSIINMQRYRFGIGEYKYFNYPLPSAIQLLREKFYAFLAPLANQWMLKLSLPDNFPADHADLIQRCINAKQIRPTALMLRYEKGGYNTLHQDLYGDVYFPFQVVFALSDASVDYDGGEFVLVEQIPRAQSRAVVVTLKQGDALIFTTNFRPVEGGKGYYRAKMKHGISPVRSGTRHALGIIFHDAL